MSWKRGRKFYRKHGTQPEARARESSPYRNLGVDLTLTGLNPHASKRLIIEPIKEIGFDVKDHQAELIAKGTAGVAVLIQEYCLLLLTKLVKGYGSRKISSKDDQIYPEISDRIFSETNRDPVFLGQVFKYFNYAQTWDSKSVMIITSIMGKATRQDYIDAFASRSIVLSRERLDFILDFLIEFGILKELSGGYFEILPKFLNDAIKNRDPENLLGSQLYRRGERG